MKRRHFQNELQAEDRREDDVQVVQGFGVVLMLFVILAERTIERLNGSYP